MTRLVPVAFIGAISLAAGLACAADRSIAGPTFGEPSSLPASGPTVAFPDSVTVGRGLPPRAPGTGPRMLGGDTVVQLELGVQAASRVSPSQGPPGAPTSAPMMIGLRSLARDTSTGVLRTRPVALAPCPFTLQLFRLDAANPGPVWRSAAARGAAACPAVSRYFDGADVNGSWRVPDLLGDSLPTGRYRLAAELVLADGRVLPFPAESAWLSANMDPPSRDRSSLRIHGSSGVSESPRTLRATAVVKNVGGRPVSFEHGACALTTWLYRPGASRTSPVWRSEWRRAPGSAYGYACTLQLFVRVLYPGDSLVFEGGAPLHEVLGDSLPAGSYGVAVRLTLLDDDVPADRWASSYLVEAGQVGLTRAPDRLPNARTIDDVAYVATTRLVRGTMPGADTVRTLMHVVNTSDRRKTISLSANCPLMSFGYSAAALRDSIPMPSSAAFSVARQPPSCSFAPYDFALEPGASWTFHVDAPLSELRARGIRGRLYLSAMLYAGGMVMLAAGDVDIQ